MDPLSFPQTIPSDVEGLPSSNTTPFFVFKLSPTSAWSSTLKTSSLLQVNSANPELPLLFYGVKAPIHRDAFCETPNARQRYSKTLLREILLERRVSANLDNACAHVGSSFVVYFYFVAGAQTSEEAFAEPALDGLPAVSYVFIPGRTYVKGLPGHVIRVLRSSRRPRPRPRPRRSSPP